MPVMSAVRCSVIGPEYMDGSGLPRTRGAANQPTRGSKRRGQAPGRAATESRQLALGPARSAKGRHLPGPHEVVVVRIGRIAKGGTQVVVLVRDVEAIEPIAVDVGIAGIRENRLPGRVRRLLRQGTLRLRDHDPRPIDRPVVSGDDLSLV